MLLAIGRVHDVAHGSLRLSLCEWNTDEDVDRILVAMPEVVAYLRDMSPMWKDIGVKATKTRCSLEDVEDARLGALRLGIPYYVFNFSDDFKGGRSSTASSHPTSAAQHRTPASTATAI